MKRILLLFFALGFIACLAQAQSTPQIHSRWSGHVLICSDTLNLFSSYQWFQSASESGSYSPIPGETKQYYAVQNGLDGYYYVQVTYKSDSSKKNSNIIGIHNSTLSQVSVAPNPVSRNNSISIESSSPDIQLAKIQVYTMSGVLVRQYTTTDASAAIEAPSATGCYLVRIQLQDGNTSTQKLFVK